MLLDRKTFFIREQVGFLKLTDAYDILDPQTQQPIGIAKEEPPGWAKFLRVVVDKRFLPTAVNVYEREGGPPVFTIRRRGVFIGKVTITDGRGQPLGYFKAKTFSLTGGFNVFDNMDRQIAEVKGDWKGWNFKFLSKDGRELGVVTKKWAGMGRELFTSADNYIISLGDVEAGKSDAAVLLLAAGLAIDVVFKEGAG